jgi:hypothetical protein
MKQYAINVVIETDSEDDQYPITLLNVITDVFVVVQYSVASTIVYGNTEYTDE